jgi:lipid II:glycine glycyltransferase (peptidoglycan interpeptide bridge formation enzyme)
VSREAVDREWDAFLAATPGGHHVQTSMWARLKAALGWSAVRLIVKDGGEIIGGAQMLLREYGRRLRIGYVPKGPIFFPGNQHVAARFMRAFREQVRAENLRCVIVQPANETAPISALQACHYRPVRLATFLQATTVIDLSQPLDDILRRMRPKTRKSIRQSQQRGVRVRRGSEEDLDTFFGLFSATSNRQGFQDYSRSYFERLWKLFGAGGHVQLFVAEVEGKPVSAALRMAFGETVICKKRGWSGEFGNLRPNEALEWAAIQWAKDAGYRYYDFEGLPRRTAEAVLCGEPLPEENVQSPASYKLGYGGDVRILPETLAYFSNPLIRWGHRVVYPRIASWPIMDRLANRLKVN